jgi:hypothetical protein
MSTFDCISHAKEDLIGTLPTSKQTVEGYGNTKNSQRKIWNPKVELGD